MAYKFLQVIKKSHQNYKKYIIFGVALLLFIASGIFECSLYAERVNYEIAKQVLRLHVIANSDSSLDQALKLEVRDYLLQEIRQKEGLQETVDECINYISSNKTILEQKLQNFILIKGHSYPVHIEVGQFDFPSKEYENIQLPAGNYQAVRVVIGNAVGQNWWCVLFPPLCFSQEDDGKLNIEAQEKLRKNLSQEEFNIIMTSKENVSYRLKFKLIEIFQTSRIKWSGVLQKVF